MLKEVRKSKGLSQKELAEKSGVTLRMIQAYECASRDIDGTNIRTLCALANALDAPVSDILNSRELAAEVKKTKL